MSFIDTVTPLSLVDESGARYWYASAITKHAKTGNIKTFRRMYINRLLRDSREDLSIHFVDTARYSVGGGQAAKDIKISEQGMRLISEKIELHIAACAAGKKGEFVTRKRRTNLPLLRPQTNDPSPVDLVGAWHRKSIGVLFGGRSIKTIAWQLRNELFREVSSMFREKYGREKHGLFAELLRASDRGEDGSLQRPRKQAQKFSGRYARIGLGELFLDGSISQRFSGAQKGKPLEIAYLFHAIFLDRACKWEKRGAAFLSAAYLNEAILLAGVIGGIAALSNSGRKGVKPEKDAKEIARELWGRFKSDESLYKNKTAFIEDILQKDIGVRSEKTVRRWVDEFEGKKKTGKGLKVSSNLIVWSGHKG